VGFPESVLTKDERVVLHLHPHWKALIRSIFVVLVAIAAVAVTAVFMPAGWSMVALYGVGAVALVAVGWLAFWPWLVWRTTHYVFTNERIIFQFGVFSRDRRDIPLMRVNDHSMNQTFIERILGCGTLVIESAGERGQSILKDIPRVGMVQTKLYELVEADRDLHSFGDDEQRRVLRQSEKSEEKQ
jgi:uncharacterized membrane protein YdbT with pleckstrin-like domain